MLLSLAVENYRSFGEEFVLDMQRREFKTLRPSKGESWQSQTLRRAALLGPNAAGKSNALKPLHLLKRAVQHSLSNPETLKTLYDPHKQHMGEPASFHVEFVQDGIRYLWFLELDATGILREELDAVVNSRWSKAFRRNGSDVEFGQSMKIPSASKENIRAFMRPTALVLSAWTTIKDKGQLSGALEWWAKVLPLIESNDMDQAHRHQWTIELSQKFPSLLKTLSQTIRAADVGVQQLSIHEQAPDAVAKFVVDFGVEPEQVALVERLDPDDVEELFKYFVFHHSGRKGSFELPELEESAGTRAWIDLATPALFALAIGGILSVDELDSSLHPFLVREIIGLFADTELNPHGAQLLFSTHDSTLLGRHPEEPMERSELWIIEKTDSESELIALDEFPTRPNHNLEKQYLQGAFGAVPIAQTISMANAIDELRKSIAQGR
ncbi:AAA family ATPase [Corynebacterium sp. zg254]|uniref:ATP-binding protein n=1 Tax=Corynebacterium zhongnanshanii TaxID=2768834 RepID=A0ABQ6VFC3_9CORY|nr:MULTISPECIES: ATP-binding protein [Corynebacterium]KAB3523075.1 ATP-binding protein [Corynebacterium zhongnanshanii]MCR5913831.1 AAA family ATPase [Corynebacterium sp. zg254]